MSTTFPMLTILHPIVLTHSDRKAVSRTSLQVVTDHSMTLQTDKWSIKSQLLKTLLVIVVSQYLLLYGHFFTFKWRKVVIKVGLSKY